MNMRRQLIRFAVIVTAFTIGVSSSVLWSLIRHHLNSGITLESYPETIGGYKIIRFEGTLIKYSPHMGVRCGGLYAHQVALYRVDKILGGEYTGEEIVVDHPACDENVFKDIPLGSRVRVLVNARQSYDVVTISAGIRGEENPSNFYVAESGPIKISGNDHD